jgi:hypothetical protein
MIALRKEQPAFGMQADTQVVQSTNPHLYSFVKYSDRRQVLVVANFSAQAQTVPAQDFPFPDGTVGRDLLQERSYTLSGDLTIEPYRLVWIAVNG